MVDEEIFLTMSVDLVNSFSINDGNRRSLCTSLKSPRCACSAGRLFASGNVVDQVVDNTETLLTVLNL